MSQVLVAAPGNTFIATYGSLRRGMQNFRVNANGNGVYVGTGKSDDNINLYRYGGSYFPSISLKHDSNGTPVVLDVFEAPEGRTGLQGSYDMLEGYPSFYNRTQIPVTLDNGDTLSAWVYHIDEEQSELVESGDWCTHNIPNYYDQFTTTTEAE